MTNYSPSIIRATFLFIVCTINKAYNLNIRNDYLLIYIFVVNIFINPFNIYNNGFLFSYLISYALIKFGNIVNNYQNYFLKLFMTSLISFLVSIPIIINSYFSINLLTPFLNLFFVPLISFIVFPLSLLSFAIEPLDNLLFILTSMMEKLSLFMSQIKNFNVTLAHIPFYCLIIYYVVIIFIINKLKIKEYKYIVILLMILFFHHNINYLKEDATIYFINVGQGDSILISLPHNQGNILIDCSNKQQYKTNSWSDTKKNYNVGKNVIEPFLKAQGINKLDYMIITHGDYDHIGSLVYLLKTFPIKHVIFNSGHDNYYETEALKLIKKNKINFSRLNTNILKIDKYSFYFLNNVDKENENEDSLVIYTIINNFKILLMGDAGIPTEKYLLNAYNIINVDILKVGHHGSKYGTSKDFLKRINPKYSIISVGANNKFNHPSKEVINNLAFSNLYLTSINGSIKIVLKPNILVETVR